MNHIKTNVIEREMLYNGEVVLKYHIEYPSISGSRFEFGKMKFNYHNKKLAFDIKNRTEDELYNEAVETYKYNKENGYPIMVYEVYRKFYITMNREDFVSLYIDEYTFTGGAHGSTIRTSQNWNLIQGTMIQLADLFPNNPYFMLHILKEINLQIAKELEIYFEDSCNLVLDTFNPESFYITPRSIVIYFQQYDIAPYSSGIRTFDISYF